MQNLISITLCAFLLLAFQLAPLPAQPAGDHLLIRKIPLAHCAKGPALCAKCREMGGPKYCLLKLCTPDGTARRVIEVTENGKKAYREFDVVKIFTSREEAQIYAQKHAITDVKWEDAP
jgi:hypothetical protein